MWELWDNQRRQWPGPHSVTLSLIPGPRACSGRRAPQCSNVLLRDSDSQRRTDRGEHDRDIALVRVLPKYSFGTCDLCEQTTCAGQGDDWAVFMSRETAHSKEK